MSKITRHIGSYTNTGTRVIVVFREIPEDEGHCLVIESDSLPEFYRDAVSHVVSHGGQGTKDLYEVLHRETMPNGANMLQALHDHRLLHRVPTANVNMHPTRDYTVRLDELNTQLRAVDELDDNATPSDIQKKFNPYKEKAEALNEADANNIAVRLIQEADEYKAEAQRKLERAFELRPELQEQYAEHSDASTDEPKALNVADLEDNEALVIMNELLERFPVEPETVFIEDTREASDTEFTLELTGISQRKATEALKEAWAAANPAKVKTKK